MRSNEGEPLGAVPGDDGTTGGHSNVAHRSGPPTQEVKHALDDRDGPRACARIDGAESGVWLMSRTMKRLVLTAGVVIGLLALAALVVPLFVNFNQYKPRLEAAISDAVGMDVRIDGRLSAGLFPGVHVTAENGRVLDERGVVVASAKRTRIGVALLPLLRREVRLSKADFERPVLSVVRDAGGHINVERLKKAMALVGALDGARVSLSNGTLSYADLSSGDTTEVRDFDVTVGRLRFGRTDHERPWKDLALQAKITCGEVRAPGFLLTDLEATVDGNGGIIRLQPVAMEIFGARMTGDLEADLTGPVPVCQMQCSLPRFAIGDFLERVSQDRAVEGEMDFSANLKAQGGTAREIVRTMSGRVSLRGNDLTLVGNDIDLALSRFESSQNLNLVDIGAIFLAGPLGLAVTKGYNFASLLRGTGGNSSIVTLVSDWNVERGIATAEDVALATPSNRLALNGGLDLVHERFADLTVAVIDEKGCAIVRQEIHGSFDAPVVDKPSILRSLTGPALEVYRKTRALFPAGPCEFLYSGSVAAPDR